MKKRFFILPLSLVLFTNASNAEVVETDNSHETVLAASDEVVTLWNIETAKHTRIEGFDYAISLPNTGYKQTNSALWTTFTNEVDNSTITVEQPIESSVNLNTASKTELDKSEATVKEYKINNKQAFLYKKLGTKKNQLVQTLWLGTETPMFITGTCNATDTININKIERSLLSITNYWVTENKVSNNKVYSTHLFSIEHGNNKVENSGLLLSIFTPNGKYADRQDGKENYFQVMTIRDKVEAKQQKKEAKKLVSELKKDNKISKGKLVNINGKNAYEFDITNADNTVKGYATVTFGKEHIFIFLANANQDIDKNIQKYKEIARTLQIK